MHRYLPVALALIALSPDLGAQPGMAARNRAYLELLGSGLAYSLNYERTVADRLSLRIGAGGAWAGGLTYLVGLGGANWHVGAGRHSGLIGLTGGVIWLEDVWILEGNEEVDEYAAVTLGYRFQPASRGFFLQAAFTPIVTEQDVAAWAGVGLGVAF